MGRAGLKTGMERISGVLLALAGATLAIFLGGKDSSTTTWYGSETTANNTWANYTQNSPIVSQSFNYFWSPHYVKIAGQDADTTSGASMSHISVDFPVSVRRGVSFKLPAKKLTGLCKGSAALETVLTWLPLKMHNISRVKMSTHSHKGRVF